MPSDGLQSLLAVNFFRGFKHAVVFLENSGGRIKLDAVLEEVFEVLEPVPLELIGHFSDCLAVFMAGARRGKIK